MGPAEAGGAVAGDLYGVSQELFIEFLGSVSLESMASAQGRSVVRTALQCAVDVGDAAVAMDVLSRLQGLSNAPCCEDAERVLHLLASQCTRGADGSLEAGSTPQVAAVRDVFARLLELVAASSKRASGFSDDKPSVALSRSVVALLCEAGFVEDALSCVAMMKQAGVSVHRRLLSHVARSLVLGSPQRPGDVSLALGFAVGLGLSRDAGLDADVYHHMLDALVKQQRLRDADWVVGEMSSVGLSPDSSHLALLSSAHDAAGHRANAARYREMLQARGPAAGGPSKLRGAPDGPSRPSMANPLLRLWNADDTVGQLIEAVTASKAKGSALIDRGVAKTVALALLNARPAQCVKAVEFLDHLCTFGVYPDVGLSVVLLQTCTSVMDGLTRGPGGDRAQLLQARAVMGTALGIVERGGVRFSTPQGFTALMKAAGSCRGAEAVWAVYNAAVSARCADDRVCNTALSHLLHHGDLSGCRAVLEDMGARGVPRTEVTHRLVLRLEVAEGAGGSKKPRAGGRHQSTTSSALPASPGTSAARVSP